MNTKKVVVLSAMAATAVASAEVMDRPSGIKIGERMTLRPYVSLSYTYDSNVDSTKHAKAGNQWVVNPSAELEYRGDNWGVDGTIYYQYHAYQHYTRQLNESGYGERLRFNWTDSKPDEKGWQVMFSEQFRQIAQDDDMSNSGGRGIGRDRKEFTGEGVIERRLNAYWHAAAIGNYYLLDYDNNVNKYAPLYGWKRAVAGAEIGFAPSKWTDILLHANYQWYWQDNDSVDPAVSSRSLRSDSKGWSLMAGLGSHATERITYRALGGWSCFEYAGASRNNGFTYQLSGKWNIDDTLNLMALGSSYYQPSEYQIGSAIKVNTFSVGLGKSLVRGKLNTTVDFAYRNESHTYSLSSSDEVNQDIWTARLGANYRLNRFFSVFGSMEYQTSDSNGSQSRAHRYDYDRFRGTVGVRLSY